MAATVSAWAKPGAWALDSEENETELLQQHKEDVAPAKGHSNGAGTADFPSLSVAAATKTNKKKKPQKLSVGDFLSYNEPKPSVYQPKGLTHEENLVLPKGPRERTAEELSRNKGFRSYERDEQPRRNRDSDREFIPSRADETDNWAVGKKSVNSSGFERRERGERNGFFTDSQSRADDVDNWGSNKSFVPSAEPRRYEKRMGFGLESGNGGADSDNWGRRKEEDGRKPAGAFDSLRERRGGFDSNGADSESWGRKREEGNGGGGAVGGRPKLNLKPRTLPIIEVQKVEIAPVVHVSEVQKEEIAIVVKPRTSNPFGEARPREEVLKEKGQDWKEIEEKLESTKLKEVVSIGTVDVPVPAKKSFWSGNGRDRVQPEHKTEKAWRKPESVGSRPQSAGESENGAAENTENGHAEEVAEERNTEK
ncbi:hypothetical protein ABFS83_02G011600 [Erythranthe nasuta]